MKLNKCRICDNTDLKEVLDLGHQPLADAFLTKEQLDEPETYYPLKLLYCSNCGLAQLGYIVPRETLFQKDYPYRTQDNKEGVKHFQQFATDIIERYQLTKNDLVVDIGSNDGTFLKNFKEHGCRVIGIDPSSVKSCVETKRTFWGRGIARILQGTLSKAKVITATNVFAHTDDLHEFMVAVDILLENNGVFIIETPYLGDLIEKNAFDQIYHEHLSYFGLKSIQCLVEKYGMVLNDIKKYPIHCGSIRYFIGKNAEYRMPPFEKNFDFKNLNPEKVEKHMPFVCISAPAKGNVLLNYLKMSPKYITEVNPLKIGKYTPGLHVPVVSEDKLIEDQPDYAMILAWNWKDQIMENVRAKGYRGKFIVPLPETQVIG